MDEEQIKDIKTKKEMDPCADRAANEPPSGQTPELVLEQQVWEQLKLCYDPEIPVNVVDLGLIYGVNIQPISADNYIANIRMTLTSPGCAMGNYIVDEIRCRVAAIPKISQVDVEMVFDPPWDRSMISAEAKLILGIL